jgi:hypothetical protein
MTEDYQMTQDEIVKMAREAGFRVGPSRDGPDDVWGIGVNLERFAALVAAAEREACAKVCADIAMHREVGSYGMLVAHSCANEILARGEKLT